MNIARYECNNILTNIPSSPASHSPQTNACLSHLMFIPVVFSRMQTSDKSNYLQKLASSRCSTRACTAAAWIPLHGQWSALRGGIAGERTQQSSLDNDWHRHFTNQSSLLYPNLSRRRGEGMRDGGHTLPPALRVLPPGTVWHLPCVSATKTAAMKCP